MFPLPNPMCAGGGLVQDWTFNPSDKAAAITLSNGNRTVRASGSGSVRGTVWKNAGKWYFEVTIDGVVNGTAIGLGKDTASLVNAPGTLTDTVGYGNIGGVFNYYSNGSNLGVAPSFIAGDVVGVAFDADAGKCWFSKNNTFSGSPTGGTGGIAITASAAWFPMASTYTSPGGITQNGKLNYAPPSGFTVL